MRKIIPFLAMMIFISSCNDYIFVTKSYDPEIKVNNDPLILVFINQFDYTDPELVKERRSATYKAGVSEFAGGLKSSFSGDSSFIFILGDTLKKGTARDQLTAQLSADTISAICRRSHSGSVITFDSLAIGFTNDTEVIDDGFGEEKIKTFDIYGRFYVSLYNADGTLINRSVVDKSTFYKSRQTISALITIQPSIAKAVDSFRPLAFQAGKEYVSKFYPKTVNEPRIVYGGKEFAESNRFIMLRNWDKAAELLEPLKNSPNQKTAMKALHNLDVVREAAASKK